MRLKETKAIIKAFYIKTRINIGMFFIPGTAIICGLKIKNPIKIKGDGIVISDNVFVGGEENIVEFEVLKNEF